MKPMGVVAGRSPQAGTPQLPQSQLLDGAHSPLPPLPPARRTREAAEEVAQAVRGSAANLV